MGEDSDPGDGSGPDGRSLDKANSNGVWCGLLVPLLVLKFNSEFRLQCGNVGRNISKVDHPLCHLTVTFAAKTKCSDTEDKW